MKLTDGDNVWWKVWRNYRPPASGRKSLFQRAKSASPGARRRTRVLRHADGIEFVVARNRDGGSGQIAIDDLSIVPLPGAPAVARQESSANDAIAALAKASPRGAFPRAFIGEQPYWTLAGSDGGKVGALIGEDASIEPAKGSYLDRAGGDRRRPALRLGRGRGKPIARRRQIADPHRDLDRARLSARHDAARRQRRRVRSWPAMR